MHVVPPRLVGCLASITMFGCADVGSNDVVYRTHDGLTTSIGPRCVLVEDEPESSAADLDLAPPDPDDAFASVIRTGDGGIAYGFFLRGQLMLEERFTVDDLQRSEPLRRTFSDGDDTYEVVFWSAPDCESRRNPPPPS